MRWHAILALVITSLLLACGGAGDEETIQETVEGFVTAVLNDPPKAYTYLAQECKDQISFTEFAAGRMLFASLLGESEPEVKDVEIVEGTDDEIVAFFDIVVISEGEEVLTLPEDGDEPTRFVKENGRWRIAACEAFGATDEGHEVLPEPASPEGASRLTVAIAAEADHDLTLPGEYINLPEIYGGFYGNRDGPSTAPHVTRAVGYAEEQGLPPAGGPHWGSGACPTDQDEAPPFCGPAPWGIYRKPWDAETLVHNMEHAGVIVWYNTTDQGIIDELEDFALDNNDKLLVLTPFPEMEEEHVAITVWSRRDKFPVGEYSRSRLDIFIDHLYCRFDPEEFC